MPGSYILQIKAHVRKDKELEFIQAVSSVVHRTAVGKYNKICLSNTENMELYKIEFTFNSAEEANEFKSSSSYKKLIGIFEVLSELFNISSFKTLNFENKN